MKCILLVILFICPNIVFSEENHLVPVPVYFSSSDYIHAVFTSLIGDSSSVILMVEIPSFSQERSINVREKFKDEKSSSPNNYILEVTVVKKQIWDANNGGASGYKFNPTNEVEKKSIEITPGDLKNIINAWNAVLKGTRYNKDSISGLDGTTYIFHAATDLFGQTWSPEDGLPYKLVALGESLSRLPSLKEKDRPALLKQCNTLANEILNETP